MSVIISDFLRSNSVGRVGGDPLKPVSLLFLVSQIVLFLPPYIHFYLPVFAKTGSSVSVEMLHFGQNSNLVAHSGGFLRAGTEKAAREGDSVVEKSNLEPRSGFEPETSSLPWKRSTN